MNSIFGNTIDMTQKSLDYLWQKQTVSLNNIANNDTPGFKAKYVTFEDSLKKNLLSAKNKNGSPRIIAKGIQRANIRVHETQDEARLDGNNVQMEAENTELVRSYLQYQYQIQSVNSDFNRLRIVIKG